ncbi:MAG TPA: hypothetical protein VNV44_01240 [Solirubrobacteraceae bacterium]|nr:hypothetical protein [Solirubrobacteraceae bacterium]
MQRDRRIETGERPRVAILVVNGFARRGPRAPQREADALRYPWIDLCLGQVERFSAGWDYEVFVHDNSHFQPHRRLIAAHPRVQLRPRAALAQIGRLANRLPGPYAGRAFERRHASALDHLARKVPASFDYVVTLDNDSFPVRDDWLDVLVGGCERGAAVSGVYRDEFAAVLHPFIHVSGLCVRRAELRELGVSFGRNIDPLGERQQTDEFNRDVGQKITYEFLAGGRTIAPLHRSNKVNVHFVLGGIYGDVVYHHGAGGRRAFFRSIGDAEAHQRISDKLRDEAFRDIDHLLAVLRAETENDLGLPAQPASDAAPLADAPARG